MSLSGYPHALSGSADFQFDSAEFFAADKEVAWHATCCMSSHSTPMYRPGDDARGTVHSIKQDNTVLIVRESKAVVLYSAGIKTEEQLPLPYLENAIVIGILRCCLRITDPAQVIMRDWCNIQPMHHFCDSIFAALRRANSTI
jgi:hypothetical protein